MQFGPYELGESIGEGGMGIVYRATHVMLERPAVVKLLRPELSQNAEIAERFLREARAAARLEHRNIVEVTDCGLAPNGQLYIALEYLDGVSLSSWINEPGPLSNGVPVTRPVVLRRTARGPVPLAQVVAILGQVANALHAAHEHVRDGVAVPIIHRDIKPDNIFLIFRDGIPLFVKLLDFGIAKLDEENSHLTRTGVGMGTPSYMPPEQLVSAKNSDRTADVYALGVVLFQMVTGGFLPWGEGTAAVDIYHLQMTTEDKDLPDPRRYVPDLPEAVVRVIHKAMARDRADRFPTVARFAQALAEALSGSGLSLSGPDILRAYAPELFRVSSGNTTLGHRIDASLAAAVAGPLEPWSTPQGWAPPKTVSGVITPREKPAPGTVRPGDSPNPSVGTVWTSPPMRSTFTSSSGQVVPATVPPARGSRRGLYAALGAAVVAGGAVVAALAMGGGSAAKGPPAPAATPLAVDAAVAVTTAVAVLTNPEGAAVFVDDELRGTSPANVPLPMGKSVVIRAELAGYEAVEQPHNVGARPETVRMTLRTIVDAGVSVDASVDAAPTSTRPLGGRPGGRPGGTRPGGEKPTGSGTGSTGAGSGTGSSKPWDPNSVGGS